MFTHACMLAIVCPTTVLLQLQVYESTFCSFIDPLNEGFEKTECAFVFTSMYVMPTQASNLKRKSEWINHL